MVDCTTADGTVVELWTGNGGANQAWTSTGAGELQVSIGGATKCLDASGGGTANGTADGAFTELWDCKPAGSNNQKWTPGGGSAPAGRMAAPYLYEGWGNPPSPTTVMAATGIHQFTMAFVLRHQPGRLGVH